MNPKMTTQDYWDLGFKHAANGDHRQFPAESKSWQGISYNKGVAAWTMKGADYERRVGKSTVMTELAKHFPPPAKPGLKATTVWVEEAAEITEKQWRGINIKHMEGNTTGWPRAAAEHARLLAIEANANPAKRERLTRSLHRLQQRHGQ